MSSGSRVCSRAGLRPGPEYQDLPHRQLRPLTTAETSASQNCSGGPFSQRSRRHVSASEMTNDVLRQSLVSP